MIFKQQQIDKYLKKPDLAYKAVVIYGSNEGLIAEYMTSFIKSVCPDMFDPFRTAYFEMSDVSSDKSDVLAEYNAQSLMGGRRVVVVKNADDSMAKIMPQILESDSDTLLVITSMSLKKKSSLVSMAEDNEKIICLPCYEDRDESIYSSVRQKIIDEGYTISAEALQLLCSRLSSDRKTNIGEIDKLITYTGSRKDISAQDILAVVGDLSSIGADDLVFFTASGDSAKALGAYDKLLKEGDEPVMIIRSLYYHFYKLLQCKGYMESGLSATAASAKLRPPLIFFRKSAFENQLAFWDKNKLFDVISLLYKAERDCKTTNMPTQEIVGFAIMQICSAAKRLRTKR